jgi:hypothetical protein
MANVLDDFILEAETFFKDLFAGVESLFGVGSPLTNGLTGLVSKLKADIEAVTVTVEGEVQKLVPTPAVWNQIINFVAAVKKGVQGGAFSGSWEQEVLAVLALGIPVALNVVAPGSGPLVTLSVDVAEKLIALL